MRRRYRWDKVTGALIEVPWDMRPSAVAPYVWPDLPPYDSPIDGRIVEGRRQRRNDLARSNCRPYEGREQEAKEAAKIRSEWDRKADQTAEMIAHRAWAEAPESVRKVFRGR